MERADKQGPAEAIDGGDIRMRIAGPHSQPDERDGDVGAAACDDVTGGREPVDLSRSNDAPRRPKAPLAICCDSRTEGE